MPGAARGSASVWAATQPVPLGPATLSDSEDAVPAPVVRAAGARKANAKLVVGPPVTGET